MTAQGYQICIRCIMDNASDPDIHFDANGVCNNCAAYDRSAGSYLRTDGQDKGELNRVLEKIKKDGRGKRYDCVVGISGGIDSTYVVYMAKKLGLRPLAVHFDNGWNYEISVRNIKRVCEKLNVDLYTYVHDWDEFRDIQLAFLRASVVDIEMITDHAILGTLYRAASREGVRYIISGANVATEAGQSIASWVFDKKDLTHIKYLHRRFGTGKMRTFPGFGFWRAMYYWGIKRIRSVSLLNYLPYSKDEAMATLQTELGFEDYGGKHHESTWTRIYQTYILPRKFGFDKRRAHLSSLINSGQMTRKQALEEIKKPPCSEELLKADIDLVLSKFGLTEQEWDAIMKAPVKKHTDYKVGHAWRLVRRLYRLLTVRKGTE